MKKILSLALLCMLSLSLTAQEYAQQQIDNSPRHHEWITINSNDHELHTFVTYPEVDEKVPVVLVIHENRGLNIWARSFADQVSENGYIAVAPDLISNTKEGFVKTSDFASSDDARSALYDLKPENVTTDLMNTLEYAKSLSAGNGNVIVVGFCWGGSQSFRFATNADDMIEQAIVFYGTGPGDKEAYQSIEVPVFGFYGGNDNRVNSTIEFSENAMNEFDKSYDYEIYEGAGHAFMRRGDDPSLPADDANKLARNQAWDKLLEILSNY